MARARAFVMKGLQGISASISLTVILVRPARCRAKQKMSATGIQRAMRRGIVMGTQDASVRKTGLVMIAESAHSASLETNVMFFVRAM